MLVDDYFALAARPQGGAYPMSDHTGHPASSVHLHEGVAPAIGAAVPKGD